jgi:U4/U6.U5 tri-snRNP-associated protein 3
MTEPPHKRARRADHDGPASSSRFDSRSTRDSRGGSRTEADRYGDRERDRRYRSRSPERRPTDRDRERHDRGGRRDDRDAGRGGRRDRGWEKEGERDYRGDRGAYRGGDRDRERDSKLRDDHARDRNDGKRTRSRSRSPRRDSEAPNAAKSNVARVAEEEATSRNTSRTSTPPAPVAFKVPAPGSRQPSHDRDVRSQSPPSVPHAHADTMDGVTKTSISTKSKRPVAADLITPSIDDEDDDEIVVEDDAMAQMQAMMGFGGFGTTKQKKVPGNDVSAVRKEKKTEYRQYMNRVGGFNRPLSPSRD